jgi:hypothetical protein
MVELSGLICFAWFIAYRAMSGIQNGEGYENDRSGLDSTSIILLLSNSIFLVYATMLFCSEIIPMYSYIASFVMLLISSFGITGVWNSFVKFIESWKSNIHLYEVLVVNFFVFAFVSIGADLIDVALSVAPGMVFHKGYINIKNRLPFIDKTERTDDPTGKTYNIPLPVFLQKVFRRKELKIPRLISNGMLRIYFAIICIILFFINQYVIKWNINIFDIIKYI